MVPLPAVGADHAVDVPSASTLTPVLAFRECGAELTLALVSLLLSVGFQPALTPSMPHSFNRPDQPEQTGVLNT